MQNEIKYLNKIKSPNDIKDFSIAELEELAKEIRGVLLNTISKNGGHLASNLGAVEITIALHKVFNSPNDKIVWDVGHQSYTHKLLTGRYDKFDTIRKENGLSGFPKREESKYDAFNTGHSSTSVSSALGIATAKKIMNNDGYTIAVIGDGALTGGLAYEGLNNAGRFKGNFIVILNDNKMSISRNVGSMSRYLKKLRVKPSYIEKKSRVEKALLHIPIIGKPLASFVRWIKNSVREIVMGDKTIFENLGYTYYGVYDGHDLENLISILSGAKKIKKPVLIHLNTKKGKGYEHAEKNPKNYHGVSPFDIDEGNPDNSSTECFSKVFGDILVKLANKDEKICAITAAMSMGTGLSAFSEKFPNRFFDVGIAEEHAVTFACGLAAEGIVPIFAVYSSFLQRSYDQIVHDAAAQKLHIVLCIDRAGIVGEDGETHQGVFDTAFLNNIPNVKIYSPTYYGELNSMLSDAIYKDNNVVAVRYPRGREGYKPNNYTFNGDSFALYKSEQNTGKILLVTYGRIFSSSCLAKEKLGEIGIYIDILKLNRIKPIDIEAVKSSLSYDKIYFFEEGIKCGGIAEHFGVMLIDNHYKGDYFIKAIDDKFIRQGAVTSILKNLQLDETGMFNIIKGDIENVREKKA